MKKVCITCGIPKDDSEYRGRNSCKSCENKRRYQLKKRMKNNPDYLNKLRKYDAKWRKNKRTKLDSREKFIEALRSLIRMTIKGKNFTKRSKTFQILGIDKEGFFNHIESKFQKGMTWDNHGIHGWHIDHIIPVSCATTIEECEKLNHYTNLQPLWAKDNRIKSNKIL